MRAENQGYPDFFKKILKTAAISTPIGALAISGILTASSIGDEKDNFDYILENAGGLADDIYFVDLERMLFVNITGHKTPDAFIMGLSESGDILLLHYSPDSNLYVVNLSRFEETVVNIFEP